MSDDNRDRSAEIREQGRRGVAGHSDHKGEIHGPSGIFSRGDQLGELDEDGQIRKPPGWFFRGEVVGNVEGREARDKDGVFFQGQQFGYVDEQGNVRLRDGVFFKGRVIGEARGNPQSALAFFVLQFRNIADKVKALEEDAARSSDKTRFLKPARKMLEWVPNANALGDFDDLLRRLRKIESEAEGQLRRNRAQKEELIAKAERLRDST